MARAPLLQLNSISLTFGGDPVFSDLSLVVHGGDRVALVGRNGSGKSTLMKVMAGIVEADAGEVVLPAGVSVGYMEQDPNLTGFATLGDFASHGLDPSEVYKIELAGEGLKLRMDADVQRASGGERRRAALARLLAHAPELMLLDEPTNHLDIEAIAWLEKHLSQTRAAYVLISHDRAFLQALTRATLWIDRGQVRRQEKGFAEFEAWRDKIWEEEDISQHKLDRKIKAEARWAVEGISARRKRNMGRVRALQELRSQRSEQITRVGTAAMALAEGPKSGRQVVVADSVSHRFESKVIVQDFSIKIARGDRVAFVGPNGSGKTTLINILTGAIEPDSGTVRLGSNLVPAVFDQNRAALNGDETLWEAMTEDPQSRVRGKADHIMVRGQPKHVAGYLKEFLFDEAQLRAPVRSLSGGEKARLLLARIMARESNLLILDEPTNDLDIETLDLLQELIGDYTGTVLLVSHDRDFLDRVATTTVWMGEGKAVTYAGGWSDALRQRGALETGTQMRDEAGKGADKPRKNNHKSQESSKAPQQQAAARSGLSFTQAHRLEQLPAIIDRLTAEIRKLEEFLADPDLFTREPVKFRKGSEALAERQQALMDAETEWLELAELAEEN